MCVEGPKTSRKEGKTKIKLVLGGVGILIGRSSPGWGACAYLTSSALGNGNIFSVRSHVRVAKGVGFVETFGQILGEAGNSAWMAGEVYEYVRYRRSGCS
jgi:hypothetical protein